MTIGEAIATADTLYPNSVDTSLKIRWLSELDGRVYSDIYSNYPDLRQPVFEPYPCNPDGETELLVPFPYDSIYGHWLGFKISEAMEENVKANDSSNQFGADLDGLSKHINSTHRAESVILRW